MHLRTLATVFFASSIVLMGPASIAMGVLAEDYVAVRILEPPDVHPPHDCPIFLLANHTCGAGPGFAGGIDNAGNVAGPLETDHPHRNSLHEMGRWLRSNNYQGENMRRFAQSDGPSGRAFGIIRLNKVTSDGFAVGYGNTGNGSLMRYDIQNDVWWSFGLACAGAGNNKGRAVARECVKGGGPQAGFYGRVVDAREVVANGPFTNADRGDLQRLSVGTHARDINDDDIIVGDFDPTCLDLPTPYCFNESIPMKILSDGVDHWGERVALNQLSSINDSAATMISDSDPPFAIGWSTNADNQKHGVLWNVTTGELKADFGFDICGQDECGAHSISPDGTMVVGARTEGFGPFGTREHIIFWTDDGWNTFSELNVTGILESAPGGEHIEQVTKLTGINDHGQVSAQALIKGEFGEYLTPGVSKWNPAVATDPACPDSNSGEWKAGNGCGIPIVLDTLLLHTVLKGDVDNDGSVNNLDITPFIAALSAANEAAFLTQFPNGNYTAADVDTSGSPNNLDITPFIGLLTAAGSNATAVPEPTSLVWIALALMMKRRRAGRR